jgi:hypothetical protein
MIEADYLMENNMESRNLFWFLSNGGMIIISVVLFWKKR